MGEQTKHILHTVQRTCMYVYTLHMRALMCFLIYLIRFIAWGSTSLVGLVYVFMYSIVMPRYSVLSIMKAAFFVVTFGFAFLNSDDVVCTIEKYVGEKYVGHT